MVALNTLRSGKRAEILRLAGLHGCRNVGVSDRWPWGRTRPDIDVDFLVDMESGRTIFDPAGFMGDISDLLGTAVDVVESRSIHPYIRGCVLAEAVAI